MIGVKVPLAIETIFYEDSLRGEIYLESNILSYVAP